MCLHYGLGVVFKIAVLDREIVVRCLTSKSSKASAVAESWNERPSLKGEAFVRTSCSRGISNELYHFFP